MPGFPAPVESSPEHDIDSDDDVGGRPMFGMVPPHIESPPTSESEGSPSAGDQIVPTQFPEEDPEYPGSPLSDHEGLVPLLSPDDSDQAPVPFEIALTQLLQYEPEPPQTADEVAHIAAEIDRLEAAVMTGFHALQQRLEDMRDELHYTRAELGISREEAEFCEGQYREVLQEIGLLRAQVTAVEHRRISQDRLWEIQMEIFGRMEQRTVTQAATITEQARQLGTRAATIAEQEHQLEVQASIIAQLESQIQIRDQRLERGMRTMRRSYRHFECERYVPEAPFAATSDASRPKRPRLHVSLEGSSAGPTDSDRSDDEDAGGATSGGSTSGGSVDAPVAAAPVEAGWLEE